MHASPDGSHDQTYREPPAPRWHDDPDTWADTVTSARDMADAMRDEDGIPLTLDRLLIEFPSYCSHGLAVATMVFYTAANYNTVFSRPHPMILRSWAEIYSTHAHWMSLEVAEAAVNAHFGASTDGRMLPAHVIAEAKNLTGRE